MSARFYFAGLLLLAACDRKAESSSGDAAPRTTDKAKAEVKAEAKLAVDPDRAKVDPPPAYDGPPKTVLVELFSSQGCDSCPAADAYLGEFPKMGWTADKVIPLTFHVTYWDDLGWQDPYGSQLHDQRQISYAQQLPRARADSENTFRGPYTPQLVVDGRVHFSGELREVAKEEIERARKRPTLVKLDNIEVSPQAQQLAVKVKSSNGEQAKFDTDRAKIGVFAVLAQKEVQTQVPRGENKGKTLQEFFVVRDFVGPRLFRSSRPVNESEFALTLPDKTKGEDFEVVVFVQDLATQEVYAARRVGVARG